MPQLTGSVICRLPASGTHPASTFPVYRRHSGILVASGPRGCSGSHECNASSHLARSCISRKATSEAPPEVCLRRRVDAVGKDNPQHRHIPWVAALGEEAFHGFLIPPFLDPPKMYRVFGLILPQRGANLVCNLPSQLHAATDRALTPCNNPTACARATNLALLQKVPQFACGTSYPVYSCCQCLTIPLAHTISCSRLPCAFRQQPNNIRSPAVGISHGLAHGPTHALRLSLRIVMACGPIERSSVKHGSHHVRARLSLYP